MGLSNILSDLNIYIYIYIYIYINVYINNLNHGIMVACILGPHKVKTML